MAIMGGAIIPKLMGAVADATNRVIDAINVKDALYATA